MQLVPACGESAVGRCIGDKGAGPVESRGWEDWCRHWLGCKGGAQWWQKGSSRGVAGLDGDRGRKLLRQRGLRSSGASASVTEVVGHGGSAHSCG